MKNLTELIREHHYMNDVEFLKHTITQETNINEVNQYGLTIFLKCLIENRLDAVKYLWNNYSEELEAVIPLKETQQFTTQKISIEQLLIQCINRCSAQFRRAWAGDSLPLDTLPFLCNLLIEIDVKYKEILMRSLPEMINKQKIK